MWWIRLREWSRVTTVLVAGVLVLAAFLVLPSLARKADDLSEEAVRRAVVRAVMQCYALEGQYPPDLDYLADRYGLILDEERYRFVYEAPGANIFPVIEVIAR